MQLLNAGPDFPCERCYKHSCNCVWESTRYMLQFARRLGASRPGPRAGKRAVASAPTPALPPVPVLDFWWMHPRRQFLRRLPLHQLLRLCCALPALVVLAPMPSLGPLALRLPLVMCRSILLVRHTTCLLVGPAGLGSASAALFWRSQLSRAKELLSLPTTTSSSSVPCISRRLNTVSPRPQKTALASTRQGLRAFAS